MKNVPLFPLGRRGYIFSVLNALLAIGLTVVSFRYVQPVDCYRFCGPLDGMPCPTGACRWGEQKAGWPLPAFVDSPGGGSPTWGWGILGPEDPPLFGLILNVLFYSLLIWLAFFAIQLVRGRVLPLKLVAITLLLNFFLAACLWLIYFYLGNFGFFGSYTYIGRGQMLAVQVDTPTSIIYAQGFSPNVSISLEEVIEKYGEPDYVRIDRTGPPETPTIRMALYWDSIKMSVELPQVESKIYTVKKATDVEMIIFIDGEQYLGLSEIPFDEDKILWKGYGNY